MAHFLKEIRYEISCRFPILAKLFILNGFNQKAFTQSIRSRNFIC